MDTQELAKEEEIENLIIQSEDDDDDGCAITRGGENCPSEGHVISLSSLPLKLISACKFAFMFINSFTALTRRE